MLESSLLVIQPWQPAPAGCWSCSICERDRAGRLGVARWQYPAARLVALARVRVEVYETADEALLLTARSGWLPLLPWRVTDAEERLVGQVFGSRVLDQFGRPFVQIERQADTSRFVTAQGRELASLHPGPDGRLLRFDPFLDAYPFAKMLLLAAALRAQAPNGASR
jgi:hypothetical protein